MWFGRHPRKALVRLLAVAIGAFIIFKFVFVPAFVAGESMYPSYRDGQFIFINRLAYLIKEPGRGDVVGIALAGRSVMYMKRVVGLPKESIAIRGGSVYINGSVLPEPYIAGRFPWEEPPVTLEKQQYFVIGDNRVSGQQLHLFGKVERRYISGKSLW